MWRVFAVVSLLICSAASAADLPSEDSAQGWLTKMATALRTKNYDMSFVVLQPQSTVEPYRWRHAIVDGKEMEHLSLLNGPGREMVRIDDKVSVFEPNVPAYSQQSDTINGPLPAILFREPLDLADAYNFVLVGRSRISGRATQQIRVICKDKTRYGFNLWLDQESGLLLKMDMVDQSGKIIEQVQVASLSVTEKPADIFQKIEEEKLPDIVNNSIAALPEHKWQLRWLPQGMNEVRRDTHRLSVTGNVIDYILYSDGLVDISVYIQDDYPGESNKNLYRHGAETYYSFHQGNLEITVVGKIPPQTADRMAQSLAIEAN
ncbi:MucB/RseB C-terminal domain-containing protein [Neptunicella marina]|uniref:MucB/RseB C-terminal domain-containing protein n=1 Tax=Neptunicella marina TaxID=2125989 RepID=A0A8J6M2X8_9ALTE|nr:MucB/RseB C-terminal domain-containing protein [Neptunicella marina]MBC3766883.1 MucB/RseB C-terminal domain-containing protein [Neptunicella marina]